MNDASNADAAVAWLRQVSPYFRRHRGKTFVVYLDGGVIAESGLSNVIRDLVLLASVGIRLVVVFGARPQIDARLLELQIETQVVGELRASNREAMDAVRDVAGSLRLTIEALFSSAGSSVGGGATPARVAGGNLVIARPAGVIAGVDLMFTGVVRSIDRPAIESRLGNGEIVLLPPVGFSPTGELYNLRAADLAAAVAVELKAAKLLLVCTADGICGEDGVLRRQLTLKEARELRELQVRGSENSELLELSARACQLGVERVHIVNHAVDGVLLRELFTRDGVGTLVSSAPFDQLRGAKVDDVAGILALIAPLEESGVLVRRSREKLESEIDSFLVMVRDNTVVACGALLEVSGADSAEVACIAVHPDYRGSQFGDLLLDELEQRAQDRGQKQVFVLTTQAAQWFSERGYTAAGPDSLPRERRALYNAERNSSVLIKTLS